MAKREDPVIAVVEPSLKFGAVFGKSSNALLSHRLECFGVTISRMLHISRPCQAEVQPPT